MSEQNETEEIECTDTEKKDDCDCPRCKKRKNPTANIIDSFVFNVLDIQQCAQTFIPLAGKLHNTNADLITKKAEEAQLEIDSDVEAKQTSGIRKMRAIFGVKSADVGIPQAVGARCHNAVGQ